MRIRISLHDERADRFEELKQEIADELGYEPSNPEALGIIMSRADDDRGGLVP